MMVLGIRKNGTYVLGTSVKSAFGETMYIETHNGMYSYKYDEFETIIEKPTAEDIPFGFILNK